MKCEGCGLVEPGRNIPVWDYCDLCWKLLCNVCMLAGCCGHKPALSGREADNPPPLGPTWRPQTPPHTFIV